MSRCLFNIPSCRIIFLLLAEEALSICVCVVCVKLPGTDTTSCTAAGVVTTAHPVISSATTTTASVATTADSSVVMTAATSSASLLSSAAAAGSRPSASVNCRRQSVRTASLYYLLCIRKSYHET